MSTLDQRWTVRGARIRLALLGLAGVVAVAGFRMLSESSNHAGRAARPEHKEEEGRKQNAGPAERERFSARWGYEEGYSIETVLQAKAAIDERRSRLRDGGLWSWEALGPGNIGGRVRSILIHPTVADRIFIGAVTGGIWRTDNGGGTWFPVDDYTAALNVCSMAIDPVNPNLMYAGTGEGFYGAAGPPGIGILKSSDGGVNWSPLSSTANSDYTYVNRLAHHPSVSGVLYAALFNALSVVKSTDAGNTWNTVLTMPGPACDLKIDPLDGNRLLAASIVAGGQEATVWYSSDGGALWTEQTVDGANMLPDTNQRCEVAFGRDRSMYVYAARTTSLGEIYRSTTIPPLDPSWQLRGTVPDNLGQCTYSLNLWVDPVNSSWIIAGCLDLYRSSNGGTSYTKISDWQSYYPNGVSAHADQHAIAHALGYDGAGNKKVYFGNDGGIQKVDDVRTVTQTAGWTNCANGLAITQFYHGSPSADGLRYAGGTQDNGDVYRTSAGVWKHLDGTGDGGYSATDPVNGNVLYAAEWPLYIHKTTNGGTSWFDVWAGLDQDGLSISPFAVDPTNGNQLVAGAKKVFRSTNGGSSWLAPILGPIDTDVYVSAVAVRGAVIWAGFTDGSIYRSTNSGASFASVGSNSPNPPDRWVMDIAISPYFAGEAIVVFGGYFNNSVWITTNNGSTWFQRTGTAPYDLPALQVNCISYHPVNPDWIYIGTDLGVLASNDFGLTWGVVDAAGTNEGPANTVINELAFAGDRLVAATYGRGFFRARPLSVVYVDKNNVGSEDGTQANPYNSVLEGILASGNGSTLSIQANTYTEGALFSDRAGLWVSTGGTTIVR